jgi:ArsR family transcriptional regulator
MYDEAVMISKPGCEHADSQIAVKRPEPRVVERTAAIFRALGDPGRLQLVLLLAEGERCVSEIANLQQESLPAVSQRLKLLKSERIVSQRRAGKHIYYRLADDHIAELVANGSAHACEEGR